MKKNTTSKSRLIRREIERKLSDGKKVSKQDLKKIVYKVKYNLKPELLKEIIDNLDSNLKNSFLGCPLPKSYSFLRTIGASSFKSSFEYELNWIILSINYYHKEISQFLIFEKRFESAFIIGNYSEAKDILDEIDSKICISLWSIEKRLLLTEHCKEQTVIKNSLIELLKNNAEHLVKLNCSYLSIRFELQLPPSRFDEILNKFVLRQKSQALADYFLFRLSFYNNPCIALPEVALFLESNLSIIDRYSIFLQIVSSSLCNKNADSKLIESIKFCLSNLNEPIPDPRLINIKIYLGQNFNDKIVANDSNYFQILFLFNLNKFEDCYKLCLNELLLKPFNFEVAEILIKTCILLDKPCPEFGTSDCLLNTILNSVYNIFSKNAEYDSSFYRLNKIARSIASPIWCNQIIRFLNNEQSFVKDDYDFNLHSILSSLEISPDLSVFLSDDKLNVFVEYLRNLNCYSEFVFTDSRILCEREHLAVGMGLFYDINIIKVLKGIRILRVR